MVWIDYIIIALIAISSLIGFLRGFIKEVFSLVVWIFAIWVALTFSREVSVLLEGLISYPSARIAGAFALLFFTTLILGALINYILSELVKKTGLTGSDRFIGMLFGIARGLLVVVIIIMLAGLTPLPEDPWWKQSILIPPFQTLSVWLGDHIPESLAGYVNYSK